MWAMDMHKFAAGLKVFVSLLDVRGREYSQEQVWLKAKYNQKQLV